MNLHAVDSTVDLPLTSLRNRLSSSLTLKFMHQFNVRHSSIISYSDYSEGSEGLQPECGGASTIGIFLGTLLVTLAAVTGFNGLFV